MQTSIWINQYRHCSGNDRRRQGGLHSDDRPSAHSSGHECSQSSHSRSFGRVNMKVINWPTCFACSLSHWTEAEMTSSHRRVNLCGNPFKLPSETTGISTGCFWVWSFPGNKLKNSDVIFGGTWEGAGRTTAGAGTASLASLVSVKIRTWTVVFRHEYLLISRRRILTVALISPHQNAFASSIELLLN